MDAQTRILASTVLALALAAPLAALGQGAGKLAATFDERYPAEQLPPRAPAEQKPMPPPPEQTMPAPVPEHTGTPAPVEHPSSQPPAQQTKVPAPSSEQPLEGRAQAPSHRQPEAAQARYAPKRHDYAPNASRSARSGSGRRSPSRVVVVPRSFLDAGTEVLPGERKFLDYAFPPTHLPMDVVTNTGGRVGWHNSPLPGPFFPTNN
jgi:hypothetical protein